MKEMRIYSHHFTTPHSSQPAERVRDSETHVQQRSTNWVLLTREQRGVSRTWTCESSGSEGGNSREGGCIRREVSNMWRSVRICASIILCIFLSISHSLSSKHTSATQSFTIYTNAALGDQISNDLPLQVGPAESNQFSGYFQIDAINPKHK